MRIFTLLVTLIALISACKKKGTSIDPNNQCLIPTEVKIQHISGQAVSFTLVGSDSLSIGKVAWTIITEEKTLEIETNGKALVIQNFSKGGEFRVTAVVETLCKTKTTLTRSETIQIERYSRQWIRDIGQSKDSIQSRLIESPNGGCVAVVYDSNYDNVVVSIDGKGNIVWEKLIKDSGIVISIVAADDGGYILGTNTKTNRYGLLKISSTGEKMWEKEFYGSTNPNSESGDYLRKVINASDGGYILAGYSSSLLGNHKSSPPKNINAGDQFSILDYWIIKVDAQGRRIWDKTIGGDMSEYLSNIIAMSDGGYLINGVSFSKISIDKTEDTEGNQDNWLVKITKLGNIEWNRVPDGGIQSNMVGMPDGSVIMTKQEYADRIGYVKFNSSGRKLWEKEINGSDFTILPTIEGGFMMFGNLNQYNMIQFSKDGDVQERRLIELGEGLLRPWDVAVGSSLGGFYGTLSSGSNKSIFHVK